MDASVAHPPAPTPAPSRTRPWLPLALAAGWFVLLTALVLFSELGRPLEGLPSWTLLFLAAYAGTILALRRADPGAWSAAAVWLGLAVLAALGQLLVPEIHIRDTPVRTVAFVGVVDLVLPLWIALRALLMIRPGTGGRLAAAAAPVYLAAVLFALTAFMPGESFAGPLPPPPDDARLVRAELERHIRTLSIDVGPRNVDRTGTLPLARDYVERELRGSGLRVERRAFDVDGAHFDNLVATLPGSTRADEVVVVGAHYDSFADAPGADDNASGVAGVLELARRLAGARPERTLEFVLFANEEPPFFNTEGMGSRVFARAAADAGERVVLMYSLETIGYYDDEPGSQRYPFPFSLLYPDRGDFIGFVGNPRSAGAVRAAVRAFRASTPFPSQGAVAPAFIPGVNWSDHDSFWRHGIPAVMITDTAPFRNVHYHMRTDELRRLDLERTARVVLGLEEVVRQAVGLPPGGA